MENKCEVIVEYELKPNDVYTPFQWTRDNVIRWVVALTFCYIVYDRYKADAETIRSFQGGDSILAIILVLVVFMLLALLLFPYLRVRAFFKKSVRFQGPVRVELRSEGIHFAYRHGSAEMKWSLYTQVAETRSVFALSSQGHSATYVPKRCLTKSDIACLRRLVRENVKGKIQLRTD